MHTENPLAPEKKQYSVIASLDIGTTKIVVIAAIKHPDTGKIEVIALGKVPADGIEKAQVINIADCSKAIRQALDQCLASCTQSDTLTIQDVYVGLAGHHIRSTQKLGVLNREFPEQEITEKEINQFIKDQRKTNIPPGHEIINVIPENYKVDNKKVTKAVGCNGHRVESRFHVITAEKESCKNIKLAVEKAGLRIQDFELQPLASASALISAEDLEAGVVVVDIGGGTTDIAVFHENVLRYTGVIPLGGKMVTKDIKECFHILEDQAEALKIKHGNALSETEHPNNYIIIPPYRGMPKKEVSIRTLSEIIQYRMEQILEYITYFLRQTGLDENKLTGGIILTGGGSQLKNLMKLVAYKTGLNPRLEKSKYFINGTQNSESLSKPEYTTSLGLLLRGFNDYERQFQEEASAEEKHTMSTNTPTPSPSPTKAEDLYPPRFESETEESTKKKPGILGKIYTMGSSMITELFGEEEDEQLR